MRRFVFFGFFFLGVVWGCSPAQTTPADRISPKTTFDSSSPAEPQVLILHNAWAAEHDPAKRRDLAGQLVEAVIHEYDKQQPEIADEVARDGAPKNEIKPSAPARDTKLDPLTVLTGVHSDPDHYPRSPVFRRMTANRLEVWTSKEGWLFDGNGKKLAEVSVPRRDGAGREWFGAFLPDGTWITTDLRDGDKQLNCFSSSGKWKWELPGSKILLQLPKPKLVPNQVDEPVYPSIGWARVDKTGRRWLVCLGADWERGFAFVSAHGKVQPLAEGVSLWGEVYPRAMGVRGMYTDLYIDSDDGKVTLNHGEAPHGVGVGWPRYDLSNNWTVVICEGDDQFGFWPRSHDVYIEGQQSAPEPWHLPKRVWFFDKSGKYKGEVTGSYLGDAANGRDLLIQDAGDRVLPVSRSSHGLIIRHARIFTWPDGSKAVPVAVYDDLKLGFFLRVSGVAAKAFSDEDRRARAAAEVVLASWES